MSGVKEYTGVVRGDRNTGSVTRRQTTETPFPEELPRLLKARNETLRGLARELGGIDHAYLSRMVRRKAAVNPRHVARIAVHLGLPQDYFPEVREAAVIEAVRRDPKLRDAVYFGSIAKAPRLRGRAT